MGQKFGSVKVKSAKVDLRKQRWLIWKEQQRLIWKERLAERDIRKQWVEEKMQEDRMVVGIGIERTDGEVLPPYQKPVENKTSRKVVERALGHRLPLGAVVHHWDENPGNNNPANLLVCPNQAYHMIIHGRMRVRGMKDGMIGGKRVVG